jgi:soluble lytic murein transglycosylase
VHRARALGKKAATLRTQLTAAAQAMPAVAPAIELLLAEQTFDEDALRAAADAEQDSFVGSRARAWRALVRTGEVKGDDALVLEASERLLALDGTRGDARSDVEGRRIAALLRGKRKADAVALARRLLVRDPGHRAARERETWLDDGTVKLSGEQRNQRTEGLLAAARYVRALEELEREKRSLDARDEVSVRRRVLLVETLVRGEQIARGLEAARGLAGAPDAPDAWRESLAWALGKATDHAGASKAWRALSESTSDPALKQEACFFSGFLLYEASRYADARARWRACEEPMKESVWAPAALWYRALTFLVEGQQPKARGLLQRLVDEHPTHRELDKHRYWLARVLEASGSPADRKRARALLGALAVDVHEWYGQLARARLSNKPVQGKRVAPDAFARRAPDDEAAQTARMLFALGFVPEAHAAASALGDETTHLALSAAVGDFHRGWRYGGRYKPRVGLGSRRLPARSSLRVPYPSPWRAAVDAACHEHGVSPAFAYAIMRQESGFRPTAESKVGARGLMQLMPYTANGLARVRGIAPPQPDDLFRPEVSIDLGVSWLGITQRELGHELLSAAAYNGGPRNVTAWMASFGHLEPELFVERVPFKETREYIKRVLSGRAVFAALEGEPLVLSLPEGGLNKPPAKYTYFATVPAK